MATQLLIKNHNLFINLTQTDLLVGISAHKYLYFLFNLKKNFERVINRHLLLTLYELKWLGFQLIRYNTQQTKSSKKENNIISDIRSVVACFCRSALLWITISIITVFLWWHISCLPSISVALRFLYAGCDTTQTGVGRLSPDASRR